MCICNVQLLWEYLAICQRAHNHSLTSPKSREETVKFIASESKSRKSFLTCPPQWQMWQVQCAHVFVCAGVCVCCVSLSCLHLLILYSNFRLMHMTLIRLHPVGGLDLSLPLLLSCFCLPLVYHCHIFFGWMCAKETTPLKHYIYLLPLHPRMFPLAPSLLCLHPLTIFFVFASCLILRLSSAPVYMLITCFLLLLLCLCFSLSLLFLLPFILIVAYAHVVI